MFQIKSKRDLIVGAAIGLAPMFVFANNIDLDELQKTLTTLLGLAALVAANLKPTEKPKGS